MTKDNILSMLKSNLEIVNSIQDTFLMNLIDVSFKEIEREGITITPTETPSTNPTDPEVIYDYEIDDANLVVMYAAYLYRNRVSDSVEGYKKSNISATGMPRMLRYALNNHLFEQKMRKES